MLNHHEKFRAKLLVLAALAFFSCAACASLTKKVARDATPEAIDSGIEAGLSDENQTKIVEAIEPERVEQATDKVIAGATDGWVNAMSEEERQARIAQAMAPIVGSLVDASVDRTLSDEHLARIRELAKQATLGFQDAIDEVTEQRDKGQIPANEGNVLEAVDKLAEDGGTTLSVAGMIAATLGLLLIVGVAWAIGRRRRYEKDITERNQALEAAVRMLSQRGLSLDDAHRAPTSEDDGSDADTELVRRTVHSLSHSSPKDAPRREPPRQSGEH